MRKLHVLTSVIVCLLFLVQVKAQNTAVSSEKATKDRGYTVLNKTGSITLYKYVDRSHSPKESGKYAPKYFFTTVSSDVLQPLTKNNVKEAFPENHPFHDAIDATIRSDDELIMYDTFHKMYKLNWLLKQHP